MNHNECDLCLWCYNYDPDANTCEVEAVPVDNDCPDYEPADVEDETEFVETEGGEEFMI